MEASSRGRIILINGTSSSGKTTLIKALQRTLPEIWLEMGIDRFAYALPGRVLGEPVWPQLFRYVPTGFNDGFTIDTTVLGQRFIAGMHATVAGLAENGLNVLVDHVLLERAWLEECAQLWSGSLALFVGVRCPLDVVVRRELERKDRTFGQAEAQSHVIHQWAEYDVEVDTSELTPEDATARIIAALDVGRRGRTGSLTRSRESI